MSSTHAEAAKEFRWQAVSRVLRDRIRSGEYPLGAKLPAEDELASEFGLSRLTIRRSLGTLEQEGLIMRSRGRGTFVNSRVQLESRSLRRLERLSVLLVDWGESGDSGYLRGILAAQSWLAKRQVSLDIQSLVTSSSGHIESEHVDFDRSGFLIDGFVRDSHIALLSQSGRPFVVVGNHHLRSCVPQVKLDTASLMKRAVRLASELLPGGPIILLMEPFKIDWQVQLVEAYVSSIRDLPQRWPMLELGDELGEWETLDRLKLGNSERFAVVATDTMIPGLLRAYQRHGLDVMRCPVVAVGFPHRLRPSELAQVRLFEPRSDVIWTKAAEMLVDALTGSRPAQSMVIDDVVLSGMGQNEVRSAPEA